MSIIYEGSTRVQEIIELIEREFNLKKNQVGSILRGDNRFKQHLSKKDVLTIIKLAKDSVLKKEEEKIKKLMEAKLAKELETFRNKVGRV